MSGRHHRRAKSGGWYHPACVNADVGRPKTKGLRGGHPPPPTAARRGTSTGGDGGGGGEARAGGPSPLVGSRDRAAAGAAALPQRCRRTMLGETVRTAPVAAQWDRVSEGELCGLVIGPITGRLGRNSGACVGMFRVTACDRRVRE